MSWMNSNSMEVWPAWATAAYTSALANYSMNLDSKLLQQSTPANTTRQQQSGSPSPGCNNNNNNKRPFSPDESTTDSMGESKKRKLFTIDSILGRESTAHNEKQYDFSLSPDADSKKMNNHHNNINHCDSVTHRSKRIRTIFSAEQLERLESEFSRQQYMVGPERLILAASLRLTESQVKVWFQNRRIKWRKQHLEAQQLRLAHWRQTGPPHEDERTSN